VNDWPEVRLDSVAHIQQGKRIEHLPTALAPHPVYGANGVIGSWTAGTYDFDVVGVGCRGTVGTIRLLPTGSWLGNNVMGVWPKDADVLDLRFLALALTNADLRASGVISGQVQQQITRTGLTPLHIPVPPMLEQRRIVDVVEALRAQIDALEVEHAVIQHLRATVIEEHLSSRDETTTLAGLAEVGQGKALPKAKQGVHSGPLSWFKIADMTRPGNEYGYIAAETRMTAEEVASLNGRIVPKGAVVFPRVGAAVLTEKKRLMEVDGAVDENHLVLIPSPSTDSEYLLALLEWFRLGDLVQPGAVPSLNMGLIQAAVVPDTDPEEQRALGGLLAALRTMARSLHMEVQAARALQGTVLDALLSGRLRIPDSYDALLAEAG
jgi:hypothetical protein